jgi:peroxiredoxin
MRRSRGEWRFAEIVFDGAVMATRVEDGIRLKAGDVEVSPAGDGYEVRVKKKG